MKKIRTNILLFICICSISCQQLLPGNRVCNENYCIDVEVVKDTDSRMRGLQFRKSLDKNKGMLFVFPEYRRHSFWMKDTLIPLDIIWLDHSQNVIHIEENVPPCRSDPCPTYVSDSPALYVLEINAGRSKELGIQEGSLLDFRLKNDRF